MSIRDSPYVHDDCVQNLYRRGSVESYSDVVEELGHVFDDLAVLGWLGLQQLLNHYHTLCHYGLCGHTATKCAYLQSHFLT